MDRTKPIRDEQPTVKFSLDSTPIFIAIFVIILTIGKF